MRIAVLADIHGNIRALEAVRADLVQRSPDVVVNLGDHISGPLQAALTANLLMSEPYIPIRGNHDRQLIDRPAAEMDHPIKPPTPNSAAAIWIGSRIFLQFTCWETIFFSATVRPATIWSISLRT
jgi:predicted phosphodiesterase